MAHLHEAVPEPIIHEKSTDSVLDLDKSREIREACRNADIAALVALSSSKGGLLHDDLRKQACRYPSSSNFEHPSCTIITYLTESTRR